MDDRDLYQREIDLARDRANAGGPAQTYALVTTRSQGTTLFGERISFPMVFVTRPTMAYGSEVDPDDAEDGGFLVTAGVVQLPQCTGYVTDWDIDDHGHWVGCWVAVTVGAYPVAGSGSLSGDPVAIRHHFTWSGVAIKTLSDATQDIPVESGGET